jgi:hypothetical protein
MSRRVFNTDNLIEILDTVEAVTDLPDGFHPLSATEMAQLEDYANNAFGERADELIEPLRVITDMLEAATAESAEDDIDFSSTLVLKVEDGSVRRVLSPRLVLGDDGESAAFSFGSIKVPVVQQGQKLVIGHLVAEVSAMEYEPESRDLPNGDKIVTHKIAFTSSDSGDIFLVDLFTKQGLDNDSVKPLLKSGEPLSEILAKSGGGGGGGAVSLANYLSEEQIPFKAKVIKVHVWDTESKFSTDGKAYACTLEDGTTVWMRGKAEAWIKKNAAVASKILADGEDIFLRVTKMKVGDNNRVSMTTGITLPKSANFVALPTGEDKPKAALSASKAPVKQVEAAPVEADAAEEKPKVAVKMDPFTKAKARSVA